MTAEFEWVSPKRAAFGNGTIKLLKEAVEETGAKKVIVVTGQGSLEKNGTMDRVNDLLSGFLVVHHKGVPPNLPIEACDDIIRAVRESGAQCVVGIGGGSVLDGAKAAAWIAPSGRWTRDFLAGFRSGPGLPFIAAATTSGTGSEVTPFIILMDTEKKVKLSLGSPHAVAVRAITDPELTLSLPPEETASTGLDAVSHALESYWSRHATPMSDALAIEALETGLHHIVRAYQEPGNIEARRGMALASMIAGLALSQTATAAVHGLTYPMTARYGVRHGIACAFLMREVMRINFHHLSLDKQRKLLHAMGANTLDAAVDRLSEIYRDLDAPQTLSDLGIPDEAVEFFCKEAVQKNLDKNAAPFDEARIEELWKSKLDV